MATGSARIIDGSNTRIASRITRQGQEGTGETGVSIKDSSGNTIVTASRSGSSTQVQPATTQYDSAGRLTTAAIAGDPNVKGDMVYVYKGNSRLLKSYYTADAQAYIKQKYEERIAAENAAKAEAARKAAEAAKISEQARLAEQARIAAANAAAAPAAAKTVSTVPVAKVTYTEVGKGTVPTPLSQTGAAQYVASAKAPATVPTVAVFTNPAVKGINTGSSSNAMKGQTTMSMPDVEKAQQLSANPTQLGVLEKYVAPIEQKTSSAATKVYGAIDSPVVKAIDTVNPLPVKASLKFGAAVVEGAVSLPTSTLRLGAGLLANPVKTVEDTAKGTAELAVTDPTRLAGNIVGAAVVTGGAIKTTKAVKSKIPSVSSAPQEIYLKTKVPNTPQPTAEVPKTTVQAEYIGKAINKDVFAIDEVNLEMVTTKSPSQVKEVLIGKTEKGYTDVYTKITPSEANALSKKITAKTENVNINRGEHALVIEPTGILETPVKSYTVADAKRLSTPSVKMIGDFTEATPVSKLRLEKQLELRKGQLETFERGEQLSLPEFTYDMEMTARKPVTGERQIKDTASDSNMGLGIDRQISGGTPIDYTPTDFKYRKSGVEEVFSPDYKRTDYTSVVETKPAKLPDVVNDPIKPVETVKKTTERPVYKYEITEVPAMDNIPISRITKETTVTEPRYAMPELEPRLGTRRPTTFKDKVDTKMSQAEFDSILGRSGPKEFVVKTESKLISDSKGMGETKLASDSKRSKKLSSVSEIPRTGKFGTSGLPMAIGASGKSTEGINKNIPNIDKITKNKNLGYDVSVPNPTRQNDAGRKSGIMALPRAGKGITTETRRKTSPATGTITAPITVPITSPITVPVSITAPARVTDPRPISDPATGKIPVPKPITQPYPEPVKAPDLTTGGGGGGRVRSGRISYPSVPPVFTVKEKRKQKPGNGKKGDRVKPGMRKNRYINPLDIDLSKANFSRRASKKKKSRR